MRKILVFDRITPDGAFTTADGDEQPITVRDPKMDRDLMADAGPVTYLFGRKTYEHMARFWPNAENDPALPPAMRKMAKTLNEDEKIVFSRTLRKPAWKNTRVLGKIDPAEVRAMKAAPGNDFMILGSGSIVAQLTAHGLIDEYVLVLSPVLLGRGRPLFDAIPAPVPLKLRSAKAYPSGNVVLRYRKA